MSFTLSGDWIGPRTAGTCARISTMSCIRFMVVTRASFDLCEATFNKRARFARKRKPKTRERIPACVSVGFTTVCICLTRCNRVCNYRILRNTTHLDYIVRVIRISPRWCACARACVSIRQTFPRNGIYFTVDN